MYTLHAQDLKYYSIDRSKPDTAPECSKSTDRKRFVVEMDPGMFVCACPESVNSSTREIAKIQLVYSYEQYRGFPQTETVQYSRSSALFIRYNNVYGIYDHSGSSFSARG